MTLPVFLALAALFFLVLIIRTTRKWKKEDQEIKEMWDRELMHYDLFNNEIRKN